MLSRTRGSETKTQGSNYVFKLRPDQFGGYSLLNLCIDPVRPLLSASGRKILLLSVFFVTQLDQLPYLCVQ